MKGTFGKREGIQGHKGPKSRWGVGKAGWSKMGLVLEHHDKHYWLPPDP